MRRVGVLMGWIENEPEFRSWLAAFVTELARLGWVDGRDVRIDVRWTNNDIDRTRVFAKELVQLQPDVILVGTNLATSAVYQETRTIPIVFSPVTDPIASGLVDSFPRPGRTEPRDEFPPPHPSSPEAALLAIEVGAVRLEPIISAVRLGRGSVRF
jgi:putative ABC transport system substrate-binding protein